MKITFKMSKLRLIDKNSAFKKRIRTYALVNDGHKDISDFFDSCFEVFEIETKKILRELSTIKVNACLEVRFSKKVQNNETNNELDIDEIHSNEIEICDIFNSFCDEFHEHDQTDQCNIFNDLCNDDTVKMNENEVEISYFFQTKNEKILPSTNLKVWYSKHIVDPMNRKISEFQAQGSGWSLKELIELCFNINKFVFFNGSSYLPLSTEIANKKAVINVKNNDNKCFVWSILAALKSKVIKNNPQRVKCYEKYIHELNLNEIEFPVTLNQIKTFEKNNPSISINVYMCDDEKNPDTGEYEQIVVPVRLSKQIKENHIHLLLLYSIDESYTYKKSVVEMLNETKSNTHYCWIKDLPKLISNSVSKHKSKIFICDRCLHFFYSEANLDNHKVACSQLNFSKITLPSVDEKWCAFKNFQRQLQVPFIIFADIEAILSEVDTVDKAIKGAYQKHKAHSIGFYFHSRYEEVESYYRSYNGLDCIDWFCEQLKYIAKTVWKILAEVKPMDELTVEENLDHTNATVCHICSQPFMCDEIKVHDHSHLTGKYRGAAHNACNLNYKESRNVPVVFHNLQYDLHFLIEKIAASGTGNIDIIPMNAEKYISFTKRYETNELFDENEIMDLMETNEDEEMDENVCLANKNKIKLRFIDSYRFMPESLQKLASYLSKDEFGITKKVWSELDDEKFELITEKGKYPYDYMDSLAKFTETSLPSIENFYNRLTDSNISQNDYDFAKKIWKEFKIQNMQEYTDIYLKVDVLILADVFENFRTQCIQIYKLDPAHYFTTPGYSWDAMLKQTNVQIELITDVDQLLFIEQGKQKQSIFVHTNSLHNFIFFSKQKHYVVEYVNAHIATSKPTTNIWEIMMNKRKQSI